jgi:hypothetical protein
MAVTMSNNDITFPNGGTSLAPPPQFSRQDDIYRGYITGIQDRVYSVTAGIVPNSGLRNLKPVFVVGAADYFWFTSSYCKISITKIMWYYTYISSTSGTSRFELTMNSYSGGPNVVRISQYSV